MDQLLQFYKLFSQSIGRSVSQWVNSVYCTVNKLNTTVQVCTVLKVDFFFDADDAAFFLFSKYIEVQLQQQLVQQHVVVSTEQV